MTVEPLNNLVEKIKKGTATSVERLAVLKELNVALRGIREIIREAKSKKRINKENI